MSHNQSRPDKSETAHYRKTGRSANTGQQKGFSNNPGKGGGGGAGPPPSPASSLSSNRSFKRSNNYNNVQGGHSRFSGSGLAPESSNASTVQRAVQNGAHGQLPPHGASDATVAGVPGTQKTNQSDQKAPSLSSATSSSDATALATTAKVAGDGSKGFAFQFGSLSPGLVNGMQIPARTTSAPPNLDEQKRDQARYDSTRAAPPVPIPPIPKQQLPRKDAGSVDHSISAGAHPLSKTKWEPQVSSVSPVPQTQKPSVPTVSAMPMRPFHQPQVSSVQFGAPVQPKGMTVRMPIPMGGVPQVQQQMFVPGLQQHSLQPQGVMSQGQVMSFSTQMGPQMGNLAVGITPQYSQQQSGRYNVASKPVKITDPNTHEELRLDKRVETLEGGSPGLRPHPNPPHSHPISPFTPVPSPNYYANSFNAGVYYPMGSLPPSSAQITSSSQPPRFNYPVSQAPQPIPYMNPSALNALPSNKAGTLTHVVSEPLYLDPAVVSSVSSHTVQVTVKPAPGSDGEKLNYSPPSIGSPAAEKGESPKHLNLTGGDSLSNPHNDSELHSESSQPQLKHGHHPVAPMASFPMATKPISAASVAIPVGSPAINVIPAAHSAPALPPEVSPSVVINTEGRKKDSLSRSNSLRDHPKKPAKKGHLQPLQQVVGPSTSLSTLASEALEHEASSNGGVSESVKAKAAQFSLESRDVVLESVEPLTINSAISDVSEIKTDPVGSEFELYEKAGEGESAEQVNKLPSFSKPLDISTQSEKDSVLSETPTGNEVVSLASVHEELDESERCKKEDDCVNSNLLVSTSSAADSSNAEAHASSCVSSSILEAPRTSLVIKPVISEHDLASGLPCPSEAMAKLEGEGGENLREEHACIPISGSKDKSAPELMRSKSSTRGKKKRKEILQKADAAGASSDLYMAYKGPEEKKDIASLESVEIASSSKQVPFDVSHEDASGNEIGDTVKAEPEDWEDAADISTPKLETSNTSGQAHGMTHQGGDGHATVAKKYSRDFLLKFADHCITLPNDFNVKDIDALLSSNVNNSHLSESYSGSVRIIDRPSGVSRLDRRGSGPMDDDKWNRQHGNVTGFRSGQGGNYNVKNVRGPVIPSIGGLLSPPMQSFYPHSGMPRNSPDADRWQKGLFPSPQTPLQVMHKAEKKYEVGIVTDEEQAKQRKLKSILNKLTPQNFEKLFEQVTAVNIDNAVTLTGIISQIFDKALMEPTFCEMYATFCAHLSVELPNFSEDNEKITFKRLLLNKCQEEFERGVREQEEANRIEEEGEVQQSDEEREEKRIKARRRMLGNIRLIGELYKKKMLTERIMHECINKLLGQLQTPDEEDIEALCKLMSTIGEMIDRPRAKDFMDSYFGRMSDLSDNMKLSSRVRFMLKDSIDLRKNSWKQRRKVEGPKKIEEVHRDAAQERANVGRMGRGPGINPSTRRPMDFGSRGSTLGSSPNTQMGGYRGMPTHSRGFGAQDFRLEDRNLHSYEGRPLSVPLSQRSISDDSITLGPQGGLARGMSSIRGQPSISNSSLADTSSSSGDFRRTTSGLNGYSSLSDRAGYASREDVVPRYTQDRFTHDQLNVQERNMSFGGRDMRNPDRSVDRSFAVPTPTQVPGPVLSQNNASGKVWPEERLRVMSIEAIKEFYSAKDEREVALCIKDLNSIPFYPTMISLWVTHSFERKDGERDLLAKLLVNLAKSLDVLSQAQLIKGFEAVLSTLEDAVNDAPRAAEFLGRIFAKIVLEKVIPLSELGRMSYNCGEKPGSLRQAGLAAEVLGNTLEVIKSDKGETMLNEILNSSNLRLEDFMHGDPYRSKKLQMFI